MKILIIEDEDSVASRLKNQIAKLKPEAEILEVIDSIADAVKWFDQNHLPDLIFMDIQLSDGLSFSIFEKVNISCPIIFTTAYDEYAVKAFEVNSIDYLLKPIYEDKLAVSFKKYNSLQKSWAQNDFQSQFSSFLDTMKINTAGYKTRFLINKADSLIVVPVNEIAWFVAEHKETLLITKNNQQHIITNSLEKIEKQLDPKEFYRINRQYIVSIHSIAKINNYFNYKLKLHLDPPTKDNIILDRKKVGDFKRWLNG
ncbi:MAG: response regulator transcription factor [Labilibaculum sp.]|nr:response regulator transcription factor [Labilibaculum sp.]